jgi:hypothetical protein
MSKTTAAAELAKTPPKPLVAAPTIGVDGRILEGIVTTLDADGAVHLAPMGPLVDERFERLWLRPFRTSATFENLRRDRVGVFHITDDVEMLARAALGQAEPPYQVLSAARVRGAILADACRWYAFETESLDESTERASLVARIVDRGAVREFFGFNRAKHAVVEAAILATRVHLLDAEQLLAEFERLAVPVAKTGAAAEVRAFQLLRDDVQGRLASAFAP